MLESKYVKVDQKSHELVKKHQELAQKFVRKEKMPAFTSHFVEFLKEEGIDTGNTWVRLKDLFTVYEHWALKRKSQVSFLPFKRMCNQKFESRYVGRESCLYIRINKLYNEQDVKRLRDEVQKARKKK